MAKRKGKTSKNIRAIIISSIVAIILASIAVIYKFGGISTMCSMIDAHPILILPTLCVYALFGVILVGGALRLVHASS